MKFKSRILQTCCQCVMVLFIMTNLSAKNVSAENHGQDHILIYANALWHYLPAKDLPINWQQPSFNDADWPVGRAGFGYGDEDDRTLLKSMPGQYDSLAIRHRFSVTTPETMQNLYLYVRYDDAFIAFLNGSEVARSGVLTIGSNNTVEQHEAEGFEMFTIAHADRLLNTGENLLSIIGFNRSADSSDFSLEPVLSTEEIKNPDLAIELSKEQAVADLHFLEQRIEDQSSYILLNKFDYKKVIADLNNTRFEQVSGIEFARNLKKLLAKIGDAHARVNAGLDSVHDRYLPFILADADVGIIALNAEQDELLDNDYPLLVSIDGLPLSAWLDTAGQYVPQASAQLIHYQSLRQLRSIDRIRNDLGISHQPQVEIGLQSLDGSDQKTIKLNTLTQRLPSGKVNLGDSVILDDNIGYLRIPSMYGDVEPVLNTLAGFKDTRGLIIDVRGNRGGRYQILEALYGFFIPPDAQPYVTNIAAYRLSTKFDSDHLHYRPTYRQSYDGWNQDQLASIRRAISRFEPQWQIPEDHFSGWHFMVLGRMPALNQFYYKNPVAVLSNPASFSATDGFLSAFADLPQVTIIGRASSGGSGATQFFRLPHSGIKIGLSSMASFRPNGSLFDGNGVEVDVTVVPAITDFLGSSDVVLDKALELINNSR